MMGTCANCRKSQETPNVGLVCRGKWNILVFLPNFLPNKWVIKIREWAKTNNVGLLQVEPDFGCKGHEPKEEPEQAP